MPMTPNMTEESVRVHMTANILGDAVAFSDATLSETCDVARIRKVYKIQDPTSAQSKGKKQQRQTNGISEHESKAEENVDEVKELESVILGMMTLKGS